MSERGETTAETLARVAEVAESDVNERPRYRNRSVTADPSQVYSVRLPVERVDEIRRLADERGLQPTAMLREWIIDRLDAPSAVVTPLRIHVDSAQDPDAMVRSIAQTLNRPWGFGSA